MEYTSRSRRRGHLEGKIKRMNTKHSIHSVTSNFNLDKVEIKQPGELLLRQDRVIVWGKLLIKSGFYNSLMVAI